MRPQRFSCGIFSLYQINLYVKLGFNEAAAFQLRNQSRDTSPSFARTGFNEAAAFQLRNQHQRHAPRSAYPRFNEAAAFQLRNLDVLAVTDGRSCSLQ